ncbi:hypothetical protein HanIR_Chr10g0472361 [Helianthus annuus]|nr:hypothetical protein HanIR_Chr10g0472361 [Helianthus annuus]
MLFKIKMFKKTHIFYKRGTPKGQTWSAKKQVTSVKYEKVEIKDEKVFVQNDKDFPKVNEAYCVEMPKVKQTWLYCLSD